MALRRRRVRDDRPRRAAARAGRGSPPDRDVRRAGSRLRQDRRRRSAEAALDGDTRQPADGRASAETARVAPLPRRDPAAAARGSRGSARQAPAAQPTRPATCSRVLSAATPDPPVAAAGAPAAARRPGADRPHAGRGDAGGRRLRRAPRRRPVLRARARPRSPDARSVRPSRGCAANGRTLVARGRSAFSFEGDDGTGLREDLVLEPGGSPRGRLHLPRRAALPRRRGRLHLPRPPRRTVVDEWAPLVLRPRGGAPGRDVPVAFEAPDGSSGTCLVARAGRMAAGGRIALPGEGRATAEVVARDRRRRARPWGLFLFRIAKVGPGPARARGEPVRRRRSRSRPGRSRARSGSFALHHRPGEAMSGAGFDFFDVDHTITRHATGGRFMMRAIARGSCRGRSRSRCRGTASPTGSGSCASRTASTCSASLRGDVAGRPGSPGARDLRASACAAT